VSDTQAARVPAQFGASAEAYVASAGFARGDDLEQLVAWGGTPRPDRALDVATGGGHTALAFARVARAVVAVDLTEPMLRAAARNARARGGRDVAFAVAEAERWGEVDRAMTHLMDRVAEARRRSEGGR
jgi:SAM-dependent methyltransferase